MTYRQTEDRPGDRQIGTFHQSVQYHTENNHLIDIDLTWFSELKSTYNDYFVIALGFKKNLF